MGTPKAAVPSLERILKDGHEVAAVYTQPDRPSGRGNKINFSAIKELALGHKLPVLQPTKIKTPEALAEFKAINADVAVVVAYGRILPESFLSTFPKGAVNVHFSMLPKYRGAAPVNWAIVNGETVTGVTTMQMDAGLDTGNILLQRGTQISANETSIELIDRLSFIGADLLSETLTKYDDLSGKPQDHDASTFAPIMKREDGLINWGMTARKIANRVRGFQPFPGSFTVFREQKLGIWRAGKVFEEVQSPKSKVQRSFGEIIEAKGDNLFIQCGSETVLQVDELQPEGKRRMPVRDFVNGLQPKIGEVFG